MKDLLLVLSLIIGSCLFGWWFAGAYDTHALKHHPRADLAHEGIPLLFPVLSQPPAVEGWDWSLEMEHARLDYLEGNLGADNWGGFRWIYFSDNPRSVIPPQPPWDPKP